MKRIIVFIIPLIALLSACGNNSNDTPEPKPVTADVTYKIVGGTDVSALFTISVSYTSETGAQKQETVTALPWSKKITVAKLPFSAKMTVTYAGKASYETKAQYNVGMGGGISYTASDGRWEDFSWNSAVNVANNNIAAYVQSNSVAKSYTKEITKDSD